MGKIYLEPVFAINTLMNMLILYIAGRLSGQRARLWRYLVSSALGGLYAALALLPFGAILGNLAAKLMLSLAMTALAWRIRGWLTSLKGWASFVGVTAVGGGVSFAASMLMNSYGPFSGTVHLSQNALLLTALAAASMVLFSASALRRRGGVAARYPVRIWHEGRRFQVNALLDTGNLLREPLSGLPVVLLDRSLGQKLVGSSRDAVEIPFGTAGGISIVRAVPAERVEALCGGKWKNLGDLYLASCKGSLSGGVDALLPPAALE
jgi:stage II sporulation protein GA (sporulation sigma-E factor processing peptidase)